MLETTAQPQAVKLTVEGQNENLTLERAARENKEASGENTEQELVVGISPIKPWSREINLSRI